MQKILFQGDSITDCGREKKDPCSMGNGYANLVKASLGADRPGAYEFINRGISGNRIVDLYARIKADFINLAPDYASIYIGVNDAWHEINWCNGVDTAKFERMYTMLLDEIFADGYTARNASLHDLLTIHALRRENISPLLPMSAIRSEKVRHAGSLSAAANTLGGHIFTSLDWAQGLLAVEGRASAMAVDVVDGEREERVRDRVQAAVGEEFVVRTRYELNESVYKATRVEKWSIFFILLLVTIIAAATIVGSLVMLVTEKRNDIATLYSVGGNRAFVAGVFRQTGLLIGVRGVVGGLVGGLAVCLVQILFGPVKMPGTTFLVENYPVEIRVGDLAGIVVAVVAVTLILTNFTVSRMIPRGAKPDETRF